MRILILGAGALGGYFGARLLAAGRDVTFLVRPARAALLATHGLNVLSAHAGDLHLPPPPTVLATTLRTPYDLILLSAKAYDLPSALDSIAPAVGPHTAIVPMLNGLAHMPVLDARFGSTHILGGTSFISASLAADGTILHLNNRDILFFGSRAETGQPHPALPAIEQALTNANFPAQLRPHITQDMWNKWTFLATLAGITCLLRANLAEIAGAHATPLVLSLYNECLAIAEAEGHRPAPAFIQQHVEILSTPSPLHASMLRDLESGAPIESQQIVGDLLARARRHRLDTPLLNVAHAHLLAYEGRRQLRKP